MLLSYTRLLQTANWLPIFKSRHAGSVVEWRLNDKCGVRTITDIWLYLLKLVRDVTAVCLLNLEIKITRKQKKFWTRQHITVIMTETVLALMYTI